MDKIIKPTERLRGEIELPGDKSISHRVAFIGSIARGRTTGRNFLRADDCIRTVSAFQKMGVDIEIRNKKIIIDGRGRKGLSKPETELYLGNSGTTMRILPGILAGQDFETTLTGDESLSRRPMKRIIEPLREMGVDIRSKNRESFPPILVKGGAVKPIDYHTKVASAQVKSCIFFAALYANGMTSVSEPYPSRDHTERMLEFCGARVSGRKPTVSIEGGGEIDGKEFFIPGDISSAAFFIAAGSIIEGSEITIRNVGLNPTRLGFLNALLEMGADIVVSGKKNAVEPYGDIRVKSAPLRSIVIEAKDIPLLIDEIPILAVVASKARGRTVINGVNELRVKETDRIFSMTENLKKMGADIKSENESLVISGNKKRFLKATLQSFKDHRTAMSVAIACLDADGDCVVEDTDCVSTSFPDFFETLGYLEKT